MEIRVENLDSAADENIISDCNTIGAEQGRVGKPDAVSDFQNAGRPDADPRSNGTDFRHPQPRADVEPVADFRPPPDGNVHRRDTDGAQPLPATDSVQPEKQPGGRGGKLRPNQSRNKLDDFPEFDEHGWVKRMKGANRIERALFVNRWGVMLTHALREVQRNCVANRDVVAFPHMPLFDPFLALFRATGLHADGFSVFSRNGIPLLLLPTSDRRLAAATIGLYRPQTDKARLAATGLRFLNRLGGLRLLPRLPGTGAAAGVLLCNPAHGTRCTPSAPAPRFLALEGADGVGKSTVLRLLVPELVRRGGFSGYLFFHWKPVKTELSYSSIP